MSAGGGAAAVLVEHAPSPAAAHDAACFVEVSSQPLDPSKYADLVSDPGAGAIATFTGVTRNTFEGRAVLRLEYEAYEPMALAKMRALCGELSARWPGVCKVAVGHRTGVVEVAQPSVVIAVSSPHRREALEAVHWAIDELKATVPIWKREWFEDGSVWKENAESRLQQAAATAAAAAPAPAGAQPARPVA